MSETRTLLVEIGVEDLPPAAVISGASFAEALIGLLQQESFLPEPRPGSRPIFQSAVHGRQLCTPRRIAAKIEGVPTHQPTKTVERKGPPATTIDENDPATRGFAQSCGVAVGQLELRDGRLFCHVETGGCSLAEVLPTLLLDAASRFPTRQMRWGEGRHAFVRPVHWLCVLHGDEVIPCELFGVKAGRATYGHRHHCPEPIELKNADEYETRLREPGRVIVNFGERRERIEAQIADATGDDLSIVSNTIIAETTATTEWPCALPAHFDESFLSLPHEVIEQTLEHALKVFVLQDKKRRQLSSRFIIVADVKSNDPQTIVRGYETIVRARLEDARFFFEQDKKTTLEARRAMLERTLFQAKLGTLADKAKRLETLTASLAPYCGAAPEHAKRAAALCKCDLGCDLVGEYPKLQGIMGGYYAEADGEDPAVAAAIREHYLPAGGDDVPQSPEGAVLALCDKADTLAGFWLAGLTPSGSKDPYSLHRAAFDVLRIPIHGEFDLDLEKLVGEAVAGYAGLFSPEQQDDARTKLTKYLRSELHNPVFILTLEGHHDKTDDQIKAAAGASDAEVAQETARKPLRPLDFIRRLDAVAEFIRSDKTADAADSLIAANKRIRNILKKTATPEVEPDAGVMTEDAERDLLEAVNARRATFEQCFADHDYLDALHTLAELREPVDRFFDEVLVMAEDEALRANRLALLRYIMNLFLKIADLSELNPSRNLQNANEPGDAETKK